MASFRSPQVKRLLLQSRTEAESVFITASTETLQLRRNRIVWFLWGVAAFSTPGPASLVAKNRGERSHRRRKGKCQVIFLFDKF
jgi:hypothetical protein